MHVGDDGRCCGDGNCCDAANGRLVRIGEMVGMAVMATAKVQGVQ